MNTLPDISSYFIANITRELFSFFFFPQWKFIFNKLGHCEIHISFSLEILNICFY